MTSTRPACACLAMSTQTSSRHHDGKLYLDNRPSRPANLRVEAGMAKHVFYGFIGEARDRPLFQGACT